MDQRGHERSSRNSRRDCSEILELRPSYTTLEQLLQDSDESALIVGGMLALGLDMPRVTRAIGVRMGALGPPLGIRARVGMGVFDRKRPAQLIRQPAAAAA